MSRVDPWAIRTTEAIAIQQAKERKERMERLGIPGEICVVKMSRPNAQGDLYAVRPLEARFIFKTDKVVWDTAMDG